MSNFNSMLFCEGNLSFLNLFDLSYLPDLLLYSFAPSTIFGLFLTILILIKDNFSIKSWLLFLTSASYSLWSLGNTLLWITVPAGLNAFFWNTTVLFELGVAVFLTLFAYAFVFKKDIKFVYKIITALPIIFFIALTPTGINISGFNVTICEGLVGPLVTWVHVFSFVACVAILLLGYVNYRNYKNNLILISQHQQNSFILLASFLFLIVFVSANTLGEATKNYLIELVGPIGMNTFLLLTAFLIVKYKAFNIKLAAAQTLVVALIFITFSELFFVDTLTNYILVSITLTFSIIGGYYLVKSVKKEIAQREQLEALTEQLASANERLKILDKMKSEFVSIASHQLRSPLTSIRGYASMLAEGSYGKLSGAAQEAASNIAESSKYMAMSIEDYLNVSRIEAGNMKYEMSDFSLKEIAEKIVDEMRPTAMKKGLVMIFRSDCTGMGTIHADIGKTRQVIMNLVDNSMKYTPKGTITVVAHDDVKKKKMYVTISDTGIGMGKETLEEVFDKFVRAKNANSVNVTGTGLGLFVAKKMVTEMKGKVWAESEGEGLGSTFNVEFPLVGGK